MLERTFSASRGKVVNQGTAAPSYQKDPSDRLTGSVERITFYNPENGYSVIRLRPDRRKVPGINREGLVTVVGNLPEMSPGEYLHLSGKWEKHPQHGLQFSIDTCEQTLPASVEGIRLYLGSGLIKGIGPALAERIVARFGEQTFDVIEHEPDRLAQVRDIGTKRTRQITAAWQEQKQVKEIVLYLHSHGISTNLAIKIFKQYGNESLTIVQNDPYRLARDIFGIGFKTADRIAQSLGLPRDHPSRIEAGVIYALNEMVDGGNVYSPQDTLVDHASEMLEVDSSLVIPAVDRLAGIDRIRVEQLSLQSQTTRAVREETAVYLTPFYQGEIGVAERLNRLTSVRSTRLSPLAKTLNAAAHPLLDPSLSPEQIEAVRTAVLNPVSVLTGGPGTGKTTALKALIRLLEMAHFQYALASPTGRAAKRLSEATGHSACTIHRLLNFTPGTGFLYNADNPLPVDLLVVDEVSMLDLLLANHLFKALKPGTHLLLVGDVDQLPSVGAGDVLRDIIDSGIAPVTRLSTIFRQAADSQIITNAHRINQGQAPVFSNSSQDFFLFPARTPEEAAQWVQDVVSERIPGKFGLHPRDEVQVLAPMYRGPAGVDALNTRLQAILNPPAPNKYERALYGSIFRLGDKVMQTENNYDKDVFNGDIGWIEHISLIDQTMEINFEGKKALYDFSEVDQLSLAYAISIHKSQGSEFPAVVIPIITHQYMMLQRNLLYTAITRAKRLCVLVGDKRAIYIAVKNNKVSQRYTALDLRLQDPAR